MTIRILYISGEVETLECRMISGYPTRNCDNEPEMIIYFIEPAKAGYNRYILLSTIDSYTIME